MKNKYQIRNITFLALIIFSIQSCKDFLNEDLITTQSTQSFETKEGLDQLSIGIYQNLEFHFNYEWAYTIWEYGTDEMAVGNDGTFEYYNSYCTTYYLKNT